MIAYCLVGLHFLTPTQSSFEIVLQKIHAILINELEFMSSSVVRKHVVSMKPFDECLGV